MVSTRQKTYNSETDGHAARPSQESTMPAHTTNRTFLIIFVSLILDLLAFTMILPLFPSLLDYYGQQSQGGLYSTLQQSVNQFREVLHIPNIEKYNSVLFGGILGSLFSLLQFLTSPMIGAASDVYGRRPVMLITMVGIASSYALWAVSHNFGLFVLARIVGGISKGNVSLSTTIVTDVSSRERRGKGMALIGLAFSVGFIVGPMIGAYFARGGVFSEGSYLATPALLALSLAIADFLFVYAFLSETLPAEKRASSFFNSIQETQNLVNPVSLFRFSAVRNATSKELQMLRQIGLCYFIYLFLFSGLEFTLTFLVHIRFQYTSMQQGKMFVFMGLIMAMVQGGYVRRIKPGKEKRVALMGMLLLIPAFVVIAFASGPMLYYFGLSLFSLASGSVVPCMTTIVTMFGSEDQKGTIMGIFRSLGALSRAIGPAVASAVYWGAGAAVCYIWGALLMVFPLFILSRVVPEKVE
ncbi:major facilitator superfamily domain-containing protein 10-like [Diadema antillarum]|uniref:major facilitator superfamily domain-containing protein 10-like n=1 Tax=Diadema antillarum TaxID=105358 RepID=UPI003A8AAE19